MLRENSLYRGDCLDLMKRVDDKSIDLILCDLPYGTTSCKWDVLIPFDALWSQYRRIIKDSGAVVLFGGQPFSSLLVCSNLKMYRYDYVWNKLKAANFLFGNKQPMKITEYVHVFYTKQPTYNPQKVLNPNGPVKPNKGNKANSKTKELMTNVPDHKSGASYEPDKVLPNNLLIFKRTESGRKRIHPTQKPLALLEHLIKTHTNEGDLVLDNCAGSGSTGEAARNLSRRFLLMEKEHEYCKLISTRLQIPILAFQPKGTP